MKKSDVATIMEQAESLSPPFSSDDLKLIRKSFDLSQADFARLLRVPKTWVQKREQGVTDMSASDIALYQVVLHMRSTKTLHTWLGNC
jgi:DNA-binding transcriptional regulator YiaG